MSVWVLLFFWSFGTCRLIVLGDRLERWLERCGWRSAIVEWWASSWWGECSMSVRGVEELLIYVGTDKIRCWSGYRFKVRVDPSVGDWNANLWWFYRAHSEALSASQVIAQSRRSRGLFDTLLSRNSEPKFKPTYNHEADASACRIYGTLAVKRVTGMSRASLLSGRHHWRPFLANLHITTLGHGYASYEHVDHNRRFARLPA